MKESGYIILDGEEVGVTRQCCHCGGHFQEVKGSGKIRGYCMRCQNITCGSPLCDPCVPFEKRLDMVDHG